MVAELKSKKWRSLVLAVGAMMFEQGAGAHWWTTVSVAFVASAYIVAQGLVDMEKVKAAGQKGKDVSAATPPPPPTTPTLPPIIARTESSSL
jgi:hypothetical protein